ncbi:MAG: YIP1 family protein [Bacteroidetes bacterium]|nr:YIP1 family protein [Bacteroidota bacterium]
MNQQTTPPIPPVPPTPSTQSHKPTIVDRARNILITPKDEWQVIDKEPANIGMILGTYVLPMCAIGGLATFIGQGLIGTRINQFLGGTTASVKAGLIGALLFVVLTLVTVFIVAAVIDVLAESFTSQKNWGKSFQLAAYSLTAMYLGSFFLIWPPLGIVAIICSLYCVYQLYTGIPIMKKTAVDKQVAYLAVIIIVTAICVILVSIIQSKIIQEINRPQIPRIPGLGFLKSFFL